MPKRLIKLPEVQAKVARRKSAVYDGMAREIFPKLVSPGTWAEHEIDHLIEIEIKAVILAYVERHRKKSFGLNSQTVTSPLPRTGGQRPR